METEFENGDTQDTLSCGYFWATHKVHFGGVARNNTEWVDYFQDLPSGVLTLVYCIQIKEL